MEKLSEEKRVARSAEYQREVEEMRAKYPNYSPLAIHMMMRIKYFASKGKKWNAERKDYERQLGIELQK